MKKTLILCLHVAAVLLVTAAVSMLWSDALGERGIAWIHGKNAAAKDINTIL